MSQTENEEESQVITQVGPKFFRALNSFFDREPRTMIWFLHVVFSKVKESLGIINGLPNDAYKYVGTIDTIQGLLWDSDRNDVIIDAITDPDSKLGLIETITALAEIHNMIMGGDSVNISTITDRLADIASALYEILKAIVDKAEAKTCEDSDP